MKNRHARRVLRTMAAAVTGIAMALVAAFGQATISEAADSSSYSSELSGAFVTDNEADNYYGGRNGTHPYESIVNSYLIELDGGGYQRVENVDDEYVLVETYSAAWELEGSFEIEMELPIFGGFYEGEDYYWLVFGQKNTSESDEVEVYRVVRYDKDWTRSASCSIFGADTQIPFSLGSLDMCELDGMLWVHTCHTMYESTDGNNHQSNVTLLIDIDEMEWVNSPDNGYDDWYDCWYLFGGVTTDSSYVSHSFAQYIVTDGEYAYVVDLGDAYPRAVCINKLDSGFLTSSYKKTKPVAYTEFLNMEGDGGDNFTGVQVGGVALSDDTVLVTGAAIDVTDSSLYYDVDPTFAVKNAFVAVSSTDLSSTTIVWLTDYTEDDGCISMSSPQIVDLGDGTFLLMWNEKLDYDEHGKGETTTCMCVIDADGNFVVATTRTNAILSDCQPVLLSSGEVAWYVTDGETVTLYTVDPSDLPSDGAELAHNTYDLADATVTVVMSGSTVYNGEAREYEVEVANNVLRDLEEGVDFTVEYSDNVNAGTATVTVTGCGDYTGTNTATFEIAAKDISSATVTLSETSYTCDGTAKEPTPTVVITLNNGNTVTLAEGTDYTVTYYQNTTVGTASVLITGIGNYTNVKWACFYISYAADETDDEEPVDISSATVTLSSTSYTYSGSKVYPDVESVVLEDGTVLGEDDYIATWPNMGADVGTYTVKVTGNTYEGYTGTATATFQIVAKSVSSATVTLSTTSYTYNGSARKPSVESVKLSLSGSTVTLDEYDDYTVSYASGRKDVGTYKVTVTGCGNYTGTVSKTFTITAKSVSSATVTLSTTSYTYNGTARKPSVKSVKLSLNGSTVTLTSGTDYTVSYASGRTDAGTYKVTVKGCGNYTGTASATFQIKAKSVSSATVKLSYTSTTYSGKAKKPSVKSVKLTLNGSTKTLTKGTDYTVTYSSNTKVGTATVKITGTGNYKGTVTKTFKIVPKTVSVKSVKSSATKKATVKWTKLSSANVTKYQIRYRVKGTSTWKKITVSSSKSSYTLSKLKSGKTYQVQVRAYKTVSGKNYVGSWSSTKTVKVK